MHTAGDETIHRLLGTRPYISQLSLGTIIHIKEIIMSSTSRFLYRIVQASSSGITAATATIPVRCAAETQTSTAPVSAEGSIKSKEMQPNSSEGNGIGSTADRADPSPSSSNGRETNSSGNQEPPSKRPKLESSSSPSDNTNCDNPDCDNPSGKAEKNRKEVGETREIKGVIFDMDGTLTLPVLNFIEMRRELKIPVGVDILPTVLSMPAAEKDEAMKIIEKWEEDGTRNLQLQPGAVDLLQFVAGSGVRRALMTRNGTVPTQVFLDRIKQQLVDNPEQYPDLSEGTVFEEVSV